ncbi:MAG TPA: hypothetical protein VFL85_02585 [Candidatus Saccharimonadales bacterium]|nr:hypothetical protein [Candidatus Saccharimonadales bacterium]
METMVSIIILVFVLVWASRVEINTRKTSDALQRVEKLLEQQKEKK